jgi:hypothetical protein
MSAEIRKELLSTNQSYGKSHIDVVQILIWQFNERLKEYYETGEIVIESEQKEHCET